MGAAARACRINALDLRQTHSAIRIYRSLMQLPIQISLHGILRSNVLYESIREEAENLDRTTNTS